MNPFVRGLAGLSILTCASSIGLSEEPVPVPQPSTRYFLDLNPPVEVTGTSWYLDGGTRRVELTDSKGTKREFQLLHDAPIQAEPTYRWQVTVPKDEDSFEGESLQTGSEDETRLLELMQSWLDRNLTRERQTALADVPYDEQSETERQASEIITLRDRIKVERLLEQDAVLDRERLRLLLEYTYAFVIHARLMELPPDEDRTEQEESQSRRDLEASEAKLEHLSKRWEEFHARLIRQVRAAVAQ